MKKNRQSIYVVILTVIMVMASACYLFFKGLNIQWQVGGGVEGTQVTGDGYPKVLIDPIGQSYNVNAPLRRIVSAVLAGDEMLQQLQMMDEVISVTHLSDDATMSNITGYFPKALYRNYAKTEEILSLSPDLVIVAPYTNVTTLRLLLASGIPLIRFARMHNFNDIDANLRLLAEVLDKQVQAEKALASMWRRIGSIQCLTQNRPRPRVLFFSLNGGTAGQETITDDMIDLAGGMNVISEAGITGYSSITTEFAVSLQPEVLVLSQWFASSRKEALDKLQSDPLWQKVPAVMQARIYIMDFKTSNTMTPFRVRGIEELAMILHPEVMQGKDDTRCQNETITMNNTTHE